MSLDRFAAGSPLSANFPTPSDSDQWLAQDFADDLFSGASDLDHALSGKGCCLAAGDMVSQRVLRFAMLSTVEDDRLFGLDGSESFPDALSDLGNLPDQPNDRQVSYQACIESLLMVAGGLLSMVC